MNAYCPLCQKLYEGQAGKKCPNCLFSHLRVPKENDPVFLDKVGYIQAELLKGMLADAGIPFTHTVGAGGAFGIRIGFLLETISFYVPYGALAEAQDIVTLINDAPGKTDEDTEATDI